MFKKGVLDIAPKDIQFSLQSPAIRRVLIELQEIDYHKFPNATHDLLRSFLECSLKDYFTQIGNPVKPSSGKPYVYLDNVLEEFKKKMDTEKTLSFPKLRRK